ncbi:hypothetical protein LINGRAHAP2_LOCUS7576 [Linum grandiflorum]
MEGARGRLLSDGGREVCGGGDDSFQGFDGDAVRKEESLESVEVGFRGSNRGRSFPQAIEGELGRFGIKIQRSTILRGVAGTGEGSPTVRVSPEKTMDQNVSFQKISVVL